MKLCSFHTPDYALEAKTLEKSFKRIAADYWIENIPPERNWIHNCAKKPEFILRVMKECKKPVLFMDADCVVVQDPRPYLEGLTCDMAAVHDGNGLISSILYLDFTEAAMQLVTKWDQLCKANPDTLDAKHLQDAWAATIQKPKTEFLDPNLFLAPTEQRDPSGLHYIDHAQVSSKKDASRNHLLWSVHLPRLRRVLQGSHMIVGGLGPSARALEGKSHLYWTVGVNDIGRYWHPDFLVVVDSEGSFRKQNRWHYIDGTQSGLVIYNQDLPIRIAHPCMAPVAITFPPATGGEIQIDSIRSLPCWRTSSHTAIVLAYQMGAEKIGVIGCDFTEGHTTHKGLPQIQRYYDQLVKKLGAQGCELVQLSPTSNLTGLRMASLEEFKTKEDFRLNLVRSLAAEAEAKA